ncbi:MAG: hypothetical protein HY072_01350 [Deltaproteobacteria bacterium]|nr:hypothetical protein [Deltaproteobacteria bacterium]
MKHGSLNALEHVLTRCGDALAALILLWALPIEVFSKLAIAQAIIAPFLLFYVAPEIVLYKDYTLWKTQGSFTLITKINALRTFGWLKIIFSILIAICLTIVFKKDETFFNRFCIFLWALFLPILPQIYGADREFLRLDLQLKKINFLAIYQKLTLLLGTLFYVKYWPSQIPLLTLICIFSGLTTALIAKYMTYRALEQYRLDSQQTFSQKFQVVFKIIKEFSFWQHLSGIIQNWVQTMDLFVLGIFGFPIRTVGLYAAILKLANFSYMIPMTLSNTFLVWIGRRSKEALEQEKKILSRGTVWLIMTNILQFFLFLILAPFIIKIFSHGRWSGEEQSLMFNWIKWILGGAVLFSSCFLFSSWLMVRDNVYKVFIKIYLPWGVASLVVYSSAAYFGGLKWVAIANVPVALIFCVNLLRIRRIESN